MKYVIGEKLSHHVCIFNVIDNLDNMIVNLILAVLLAPNFGSPVVRHGSGAVGTPAAPQFSSSIFIDLV